MDNASNNDSFIKMLKYRLNLIDSLLCGGEHFHIRCYVHVLNLFDENVNKVRESIKYVKGFQGRKQNFL